MREGGVRVKGGGGGGGGRQQSEQTTRATPRAEEAVGKGRGRAPRPPSLSGPVGAAAF